MILSLIAAVSRNGVIGYKGGIPWHISTDLKLFKRTTMGHYLIQGRKTYESIGRPLPGRRMVVVTRQPDFEAPGCKVVHSLEEALQLAENTGEIEVFIAGGASLYAEALPAADRMYLTQVDCDVEGDTFFPEFDLDIWQVVKQDDYPAGEKDEYPFSRQILERK
ncbi:MAG: dihydrofolate reductase [Anaerolineae bacterium]|nr:dihydrofolate reductase [Anaerolineae bacterium]